jgi:hypothetical protein
LPTSFIDANITFGDGSFMFQQYREFLLETDLKEMEIRLIARGFNKIDNHAHLKPKEYKVIHRYGIQKSQEPFRFGIEWVEG